jgi:hypothetical protein
MIAVTYIIAILVLTALKHDTVTGHVLSKTGELNPQKTQCQGKSELLHQVVFATKII